MGNTLGLKEGRSVVTCDTCGREIRGEVHVDPPNSVRDYERFSHGDPRECERDDDRELENQPF
jgi:hypothetical protein